MGAAAVLAVALLLPVQAAVAQDGTDPEAPEGSELVLRARARGVQIYECDAATSTWRFVAPAAQLRRDIIHYAGPSWQSTRDGSLVTGRLVASFPNRDPEENIPDLLLEAASNAGDGALGEVDTIIRRDSTGGVGPTGPCTEVGVRVPVDYRATYEFYEAG